MAIARHTCQQRSHIACEVPFRSLGEEFEEDLLRDVFRQPRRGREPQRQPLDEASVGRGKVLSSWVGFGQTGSFPYPTPEAKT